MCTRGNENFPTHHYQINWNWLFNVQFTFQFVFWVRFRIQFTKIQVYRIWFDTHSNNSENKMMMVIMKGQNKTKNIKEKECHHQSLIRYSTKSSKVCWNKNWTELMVDEENEKSIQSNRSNNKMKWVILWNLIFLWFIQEVIGCWYRWWWWWHFLQSTYQAIFIHKPEKKFEFEFAKLSSSSSLLFWFDLFLCKEQKRKKNDQ